VERNSCGRTFERAFGTRSTPLELFIIDRAREIMGPCWLTVPYVVAQSKV